MLCPGASIVDVRCWADPVIAEWPRSGRLITAPIERVRQILPTDLPAVESGGTGIDPINYPQHGHQVRGSDAVALVFCSLSGTSRLRD
ncbi:MAG TPA: hypothetical protein VEC60_14335 [Reyranella sp.]|nr:hypothetical protein [Reyranella sp.]